MKKYFFLILIFLCSSFVLYAQQLKHRTSLLITTGASNYMGDLGGGDKMAAHFMGVRDIDIAGTRFNIGLGYNYRILEAFSITPTIRYICLYGSDNFTKEPFRNNRDLSFRSSIFESSFDFKYYFVKFKIQSSFESYSIRKNVGMYLLLGFGGFYYNPKTKYENEWISLRPLKTEGQGLPSFTYNGEVYQPNEPYGLFSANVNMGFGVEFRLNGIWTIGFEVSNRYTTTDYLDDVHSYYYPNDVLKQEYGDLTANISDRRINKNLEDRSGGTIERGNPNYNDAYLLFNITIRYTWHFRKMPRYNADDPEIIYKKGADKTPPIIILNDSSRIEVFKNEYIINGKAIDASGIAEILLNGNYIGKNNFSEKVSLREGENKFVIKATDTKGNTANKEIFIIYNKKQVDTIPPVITLNHPTYINTTEKFYTIKGVATDENGIYQTMLNNEKIGNENFKKTVELQQGKNEYKLIATDKKSNSDTVIITINYNAPKQEIIAGKNYALFFAVEDYQDKGWQDLNNPIDDAEAIAKRLNIYFGFDTTIIRNPTRKEIKLKIKEYQDMQFNKNDQLFIFFSGHGYATDQGFFIPSDAVFNDPIADSYFPYASMNLSITAIPCEHILLVLDACHSSTFSEDILFGELYAESRDKIKPKPPEEISELQKFVNKSMNFKSRLVITASVNAISDGKEHSKLTKNFINIFSKYGKENNTDKVLTFEELKSYIKEHNTDAKIRTFQNNEKDGNFLFIVK